MQTPLNIVQQCHRITYLRRKCSPVVQIGHHLDPYSLISQVQNSINNISAKYYASRRYPAMGWLPRNLDERYRTLYTLRVECETSENVNFYNQFCGEQVLFIITNRVKYKENHYKHPYFSTQMDWIKKNIANLRQYIIISHSFQLLINFPK